MAACLCGDPGRCKICRLRAFGQARRRYFWTPELREDLREAYRGRTKRELSQRLSKIAARMGWPKWACKSEAVRLGITSMYGRQRRGWTAAEVEMLEVKVGVVSVARIARLLGRSCGSVMAKAEKIGLSRRLQDGYTIEDLSRVFGVHHRIAKSWHERGLLGHVHRAQGLRVTTDNVLRFVRRHAREYDLRRVDQDWFKAVLFGGRIDGPT